MRILYYCPDRGIPILGDKGASVHVRSFVAALARQGHEVVLACTRLDSGNPPPPVPVITLPPPRDTAVLRPVCDAFGLDYGAIDHAGLRGELRKLAHDAQLSRLVRHAIAERGFCPELLYERHALFHVSGIAIARNLGIPRVLEINAPLVEEQARFRGLILRPEAERRETESLRGADLVVAVSNEVRGFVRTCGVAPNRVIVAQNGVDTARFAMTVSADAVRRRLGLGDDPVIGFVGSFKPWHGMDMLLSAFAVVARQRPAARLLAVGDGPMLEAARHRVQAEGLAACVVLTGKVPHDEVPAHLAAMDLTVAPYTPQADFYFSPLKVMESLASGRPVVAPRVGQLTTLVTDGETGLLYPPGDVDALAACLLRLLDDAPLRHRLGTAGALLARQCWDWSAVAARIIARAPTVLPGRRSA
ncbi:MAG TPA: glycosyltransferase family 4 protein [Acetobacteraceae bacterium]|nr:glycosyltransferase family 4 protein [Acetobacteraceae bacterium]